MIQPAPATPRFNTHLVWNGIDETDPYLWLEDSSNPAVQDWAKAQHDYTDQVIAGPVHDQVLGRIQQLVYNGQPRLTQTAGGVEVYRKTSPGDIQPKVFVKGANGQERLLIDPLQADPNGHVAVDWFSLSPDGHYLAYGTTQDGGDDTTLHVLDTSTGQALPDQIRVRKRPRPDDIGSVGGDNSLQWEKDGKSFYYADYNPSGYFRHTLGTDASKDVALTDTTLGGDESVDVDNRYVAFSTYQDWSTEALNLYDKTSGSLYTFPNKEGDKYRPRLQDGVLYVATRKGDGNGSLQAIDPAHPKDAARTILPEVKPGNKLFPPPAGAPDRGALLQDFAVSGNHVLGVYLHNAVDRIMQFDTKGQFEREIPLPSKGTVDSIETQPDGKVHFSFSSLTVPETQYEYDPQSGGMKVLSQDQFSGYNPDDFTIDQVWSKSKDGTQVPVLLAHKKSTVPGPDTPTVISGYGGFDVNNTSSFASTFLPLLESGGTYALATLRGGGEFGEAWHRDGMLDKKQNVFDDFIGAAQTLVDKGLTSPAHLGAWGGSNGGLLMGAAVTQAPHLFKAVDIEVPLLDMDRFDQMMDDSYVSEYGTTQDPQQAKYLSAYSPYQQIKDGTAYPAVILECGGADPRVGPAHARKFAARLQEASSSGAPVLLREDEDTGHEVGTPLPLRVGEIADAWSLLLGQIA
ncbi:MAG TPA: prolyl oligopeptidase family serine peptidase [Candidatus Xenobia bacterium]|jgi:prolyl oligopeptidase